MPSSDLLLVAGEASGDVHGAALLRELEQAAPPIRVFGLGGERLREQGMETIADFSTLSVVGVGAVLRVLPRARKIFRKLLDEVDRRGARTAVLIDFPEFNLRLARQLKRRGVKVIYYVSPQVWAWRRGRLDLIARVVDKMLVLFGFEVSFYEGRVPVAHVGHPLVDEVPLLPQAWDDLKAGETPEAFRIALLPGSRSSEIDRHLALQIEAARQLGDRLPCTFTLIRASSVPRERLQAALQEANFDAEIVCADRLPAIANSHLALCTSGTATLEVGLLGTPMIVIYRVGLVSSLLARMLLRVDNISLVNLVLGHRAVEELVQRRATARIISKEAVELLSSRRKVDTMREELAKLRALLGARGASERAARLVASELAMEEGSS